MNREAQRQARIALQGELEVIYDLVGHPKAGRLFELAWDYEHSSGIEEVRYHYANLMDLIR